jgi:glycerophosphoryl diester phosphodiesterase
MSKSMLAALAGHILSAGYGSAAPALIAHRGASQDAPENTIAAFTLAWKQGADGIEGDFQLTHDGEIVCIHDPTTKRTAEQDLKVSEATLKELRQLDVKPWKGHSRKDARIPASMRCLPPFRRGRVCL